METHSDADTTERLGKLLTERWLAENSLAIAAYNDQVAENCIFSDGQRGF